MYVLIAGGGKVGANVARTLIRGGHEVTLIEQRPYRFDRLEAEFEHQVIRGDATELFVLERAGIKVHGREGDPHCIYFHDPDGHRLQLLPQRD